MTILPGSTIGILGGGQLGRMLALEARRMGYKIVILDPSTDAPCQQIADKHIIADYSNLEAINSLAASSDVVTYEFESIDVQAVQWLEEQQHPVFPSSKVLQITQNRLLEKEFVRQLGIPVTEFAAIETVADLTQASQLGFPAFLKTVYGGYDGKGQALITNLTEAEAAFHKLARRPLIWERKVDFIKELAVIAVRNQAGQIVTYPVSENIHYQNILATSIIPARISHETTQQAQAIAHQLAAELNIIGLFCVEMFMQADGRLLVNEIAPRPHNSGHYSIDACVTSQFEQQLRAICGLPLGSPKLLSSAVMVNILGENETTELMGLEAALAHDNVAFHLYDKRRSKSKRKMGHITVLDNDLEAALAIANQAHKRLQWR